MKIQKLILENVAEKTIFTETADLKEAYELLNDEEKAAYNKKIEKNKKKTCYVYARMEQADFSDDGISFEKGGTASLDTYQNSFSSGKWKKYTVVKQLFLNLELQGDFEIQLMHAAEVNGEIKTDVVASKSVSCAGRESVQIDFGALAEVGIFYPVITAKSAGTVYSGYYGTADLEPTQEVKLAIDICTFKREKYVRRNMDTLKADILENEESPVYGKLWVHISDNGQSLDGIVDSEEHITVDKNANLGGVGGFTRGIIETQKRMQQEGYTHVLLMDDDATISTAAVEANYLMLSYMKPEYFSYTIGGKLLVLNVPYLQFEAGAQWNQGDIQALNHDLDMSEVENVVGSEVEKDTVEYAGWWYCCMPLAEIGTDNLPLPIFIHRDDIEYGLRIGQERFIFTNQICIWHEAFAGKLPGVLEYYDIRNLMITNAIHCPDYTKKQMKKMLHKWSMANIAKYRYKYVDMNVKAVEDFCKGVDFLKETDGGKLHQELFTMNYKAQPVAEYYNYKNLTEKIVRKGEQGDYKLPKWRRLLQMALLNGMFLPAKKDYAQVSAPYGSVYKLFRVGETVVTDSYHNAIYMKRDRGEFFRCYKELRRALKMIDQHYDEAAKSYREHYDEITSTEFWNKYLNI